MNETEINQIKNFKPSFDFEIKIQKFDSNSYLVSFKNTSRYFKVSPQTAFILELIDGNTPVEIITQVYNKKFNLNLIESEIYSLIINKLYKVFNSANIFRNDTPSYLRMSVIVLNKKYVHSISSLFYKFFSFKFALFGIALSVILLTVCIFFNLESIQLSLNSYPPSYISYFVILMLLSTIFHEIGHASACRAFGADHGGIGIGFYLITPVMFADVTSAWQLPARQRIIINLGGIYFELLFIIIILALYLTTKDIFYVNASLIVLIKLLYNLNPFFRTDGYWVVSDSLNLPNLRKQSNERVRLFFKKIISFRLLNFTSKDWFLVFYGIFSFGFLLLFFYYVIFYNIQSLIYLPYNIYMFFNDLFTQKISNIMDILKSLNMVLIPLFFYYLFFKKVVNPIYKKFRIKSST